MGQPIRRRERAYWGGLAILCLTFAANKQLDLQVLLTELGRGLAHDQGWYDQRRTVQRAVVLVAIALSAAGALLAPGALRRLSRPARVAALGVAAMVAFALLRASTFHHVELGPPSGGPGTFAMGVLEFSGAALIGASSISAFRHQVS